MQIDYAADMPTVFVKGDIFATPGLRAYAHGCNCAGTMDSGIAVAFRKRWPRMFEEYQARCQKRELRLGDVFVWSEGDEVIYNLAVQENGKKPSKVPALMTALSKVVELATAAGIERVGFPRIAVSRGGLDWPRVKKILRELGDDSTLTLEVFEQFVRAPAP